MATQTGYKASELGMIPQDWDVVELGDVFEVTAGGDLDIANFSTEKTHKHIYPVYSNAITDNGLYGFSSNYDCCGNHITVTARGYIGYAVPRNGKFSSIGRLLTLKPKTEISCYLVAQYINQFVSFAIESTGVPQLTAPQIKKYLVAIPKSTTEQTAIATALSDTDALIGSLQTLIAKKKAIKLSAMQNLLSGKIRLPEFAQRPDGSPKTTRQTELGCVPEDWEVVELGEVANVEMCRRIFKNETQNVGDISFYKIGTFGGETDAYISRQLFEEYKSKYPYPKIGDILISAAGTIGRVIVFGGEEAYYQDSNIVWLNINKDKISNSFLYYFYQNTEWNSLEGSTIKRLYNSDLLSKKIALPPLPEQTAIAKLLSDMDAEIEALEGRLKKTQSLKQGMMQALLTGKIRLPLE